MMCPMEPLLPEQELERIEAVPLDERAPALEELERALRSRLDDDAPGA